MLSVSEINVLLEAEASHCSRTILQTQSDKEQKGRTYRCQRMQDVQHGPSFSSEITELRVRHEQRLVPKSPMLRQLIAVGMSPRRFEACSMRSGLRRMLP